MSYLLRQNPAVRQLVRQTKLHVSDLVYPIFIHHQPDHYEPIPSMPGQYQWGINRLPDLINELRYYHISAVLLFGVPSEKDAQGSASWQIDGPVQQALRLLQNQAPEILRIVDLCFCQYTSHGHCGYLNENGHIDHTKTLAGLSQQMQSMVAAGAQVIAPSGMIDGAVAHLKANLKDESIPIMHYSVKYCSQFYGPFRDAADGAPKKGDRASHQMDCANGHEALAEVAQDLKEGVDMAIIKPAGHYLDVIARVNDRYPELPLLGYQVSGEYAALKAAIAKGWLSEQTIHESLLAIKRAGATGIITYFALEWAKQFAQDSTP